MRSTKQILACLLFALLAPALALAVTNETQYVTQGCANNGDGTAAGCAASAGAAGAYNSWANWEGQNRDLVTQDKNLTAVFAGTFTEGALTLDGWITDATRRLKISDMIIAVTGGSGSSYGPILTISDQYVTLADATLSKASGTVDIRAITGSGNAFFTLERTKISYSSVTKDGGNACVTWTGAAGTTIFRNNWIRNCPSSPGLYLTAVSGEALTVDNNTMYDNGTYGLLMEVNSGTPTFNAYNNLSVFNDTADFSISPGGGTYNHDTNISGDTSSPDVSFRSKIITFISAPTNLHLDPAETDAINTGTDRSGSGFSDDIDSATRSGTWDIGSDEITATAGGSGVAALKALGIL